VLASGAGIRCRDMADGGGGGGAVGFFHRGTGGDGAGQRCAVLDATFCTGPTAAGWRLEVDSGQSTDSIGAHKLADSFEAHRDLVFVGERDLGMVDGALARLSGDGVKVDGVASRAGGSGAGRLAGG
jgi:hypothetical protein